MGKVIEVELPPDDPIFKEGLSISAPWRPPQPPKDETPKDGTKPEGEGEARSNGRESDPGSR